MSGAALPQGVREETWRLTWVDLWKDLDEAERGRAAVTFAKALQTRPEDTEEREAWTAFRRDFLAALARQLRFRRQTIERMPHEKLGVHIRRVAVPFLLPQDWQALFQFYFTQCKGELVARFFELCGLRSEPALAAGEEEPPEDVEPVAGRLIEEFGEDDVRRYFSFLALKDAETWAFVGPVLRDLWGRARAGEGPDRTQARTTPETDREGDVEGGEPALGAEACEEFTQVDRVAIDQIMATLAGEDRALGEDELVDFIEGLLALDASRGRSYFHLGLLDSLMPGRVPDWERPELNDRRRAWYLAGLLAGGVRRRDAEAVRRLLDERRGDFDRAVSEPGTAGTAMARTATLYLAEIGRLGEAVALVRSQPEACGASLCIRLLELASEWLREGDTARAKPLLTALWESRGALDIRDDAVRGHFLARLRRKLGQALQAEGRMTEARRLFEELQREGAGGPELLADIGFTEAGIRAIGGLRIEGDAERLRSLKEALERGREWFERAVSVGGDSAVNAHFALAVLEYLGWMSASRDQASRDALRKKALDHSRAALAGMIGSGRSEAYDRTGVAGQCRFVLAATRLGSLEPREVRAAISDWMAIDANAGAFPAAHLKAIFENAQLVDEQAAVRIAETIWRMRGAEALEILGVDEWVAGSTVVREALRELARDESRPRRVRFEIWEKLVPIAIRAGTVAVAEEGLDTMEGLAAKESELAERFAAWLEDGRKYDPAWDEASALGARAQALYRLGRDAEAHQVMARLFFALREGRPQEAAAVREMLRVAGAHEDLLATLVLPEVGDRQEGDQSEDRDLEERLAAGERVRVLFVGGNEIQARYDDWVAQKIEETWPGVSVRFEHTGWGSDIGREFERLRRIARRCDAVVLMVMMRTTLGQKLRAALNDPPRPWIACTGTGRDMVLRSVREAARVGLAERLRRAAQRS